MKMRLQMVVFLFALVAALPGCGENKVKITGKLTKNGQPMVVPKDTMVTLTFLPELEKGQTFQARFKQETGDFEAEIPPGKYKANYLIVEKNNIQSATIAPPAFKQKSFDLTKNQELTFEVSSK